MFDINRNGLIEKLSLTSILYIVGIDCFYKLFRELCGELFAKFGD